MFTNIKKKKKGFAGNAALEAMILVAVVGATGTAGLFNYATARKTTQGAAVSGELSSAREVFNACNADLGQITSCDSLTELGLVVNANIQPYATLTQAVTTAAFTETFLTSDRADACNAATGVAGTIVDTPDITHAYAQTWARVYTGVDTRCKLSNAS
jgi:hypothetical protein